MLNTAHSSSSHTQHSKAGKETQSCCSGTGVDSLNWGEQSWVGLLHNTMRQQNPPWQARPHLRLPAHSSREQQAFNNSRTSQCSPHRGKTSSKIDENVSFYGTNGSWVLPFGV